MTDDSWIGAFAIEDRVDFILSNGLDNGEDSHGYGEASFNIPEGKEYFSSVRELMSRCLSEVIKSHFKGNFRELFNCIDTIVISCPGVIRANRRVMQITLWNLGEDSNLEPGFVQWRGELGFDFPTELGSIAEELIASHHESWSKRERARFQRRIYVVNDATAAAVAEHAHREKNRELCDFAFVKAHNGVNVAFVQKNDEGWFDINVEHGEAGHVPAAPHTLDHAAGFKGLCPFHGPCVEGRISSYTLVARAKSGKKVFRRWGEALSAIKPPFPEERRDQPTQYKESRFVRTLLGNPKNGLAFDEDVVQSGVDLVGHYLTQIVLSLALGPRPPSKIVIGGRMATPDVIANVRDAVLTWINGYPFTDRLDRDNIRAFIVPALTAGGLAAAIDKRKVEALGALNVARAYVRLPAELGAPRALLRLPTNVHRFPTGEPVRSDQTSQTEPRV